MKGAAEKFVGIIELGMFMEDKHESMDIKAKDILIEAITAARGGNWNEVKRLSYVFDKAINKDTPEDCTPEEAKLLT